MYKHTITMCATVIERFPVLPGLNLVTVREALMIVETVEMFGLVFTTTDVFTRTTEIVELVSWPRLNPPPKTWALANPDRSSSDFIIKQPIGFSFADRSGPAQFSILKARESAAMRAFEADLSRRMLYGDYGDCGGIDCAFCGLFSPPPPIELAVEIEPAQPDTPDSLLVDHLIDQVAMLKSDLAVLASTIEDRETEVSNALEEIDELSGKLSIAEARERIASDRLNVEIGKRRDFEAQTAKLTREVEHEKLAREALSDKLAAKGRDFMRMADLYNDLKTEKAALISELHAKGDQVGLASYRKAKVESKLAAVKRKLERRLDDGDNSILIRELLTDLDD